MWPGHGAAALEREVAELVTRPETTAASLEEHTERGKVVWEHGSKALAVRVLVQGILAADPQHCVIVFTSHPAYTAYLMRCLEQGGVRVAKLGKESAVNLTAAVRRFSGSIGYTLKAGEEARRVIILSMDKDCAGGDLPNTTHIVFADPVKGYIHGDRDAQGNNRVEDLEATRGRLTQSLGRAVRLGVRDKHLLVYHMAAEGTLDYTHAADTHEMAQRHTDVDYDRDMRIAAEKIQESQEGEEGLEGRSDMRIAAEQAGESQEGEDGFGGRGDMRIAAEEGEGREGGKEGRDGWMEEG
jgi:hypothetical protein